MSESEPLPKWMMRRYAQLWKLMKNKPFTLEQAGKVLKEDKKILLVLFSHLRKKGWLRAEFDVKDARKRNYTLTNPEKVVEAMA